MKNFAPSMGQAVTTRYGSSPGDHPNRFMQVSSATKGNQQSLPAKHLGEVLSACFATSNWSLQAATITAGQSSSAAKRNQQSLPAKHFGEVLSTSVATATGPCTQQLPQQGQSLSAELDRKLHRLYDPSSGAETDGKGGKQTTGESVETQSGLPKRRRGRPITRDDSDGERTRERKRLNRSKPIDERNPRGRAPSDERPYERRRELHKEKEVVRQVGSGRMDDPDTQAKFIAALELKEGKRKFGGLPLAKEMKSEEIKEMAQVFANTRRLYKATKGPDKKKFREQAMEGVSKETASNVLGVSARTIRRYQIERLTKDARKAMFALPAVDEEDDDVDAENEYDSASIQKLETDLYVNFFLENTGVLSGSERLTQVLAIPKFELCARLFGAYPQLLRQLHEKHKDLLANLPPQSRLRVSIESAEASKKRPSFNEEEERERRTAMARQRYKLKLVKKRHRSNRSIMPARVKQRAPDESQYSKDEIELERKIRPFSDAKFFRVVKAAGVRYTKKNKPYNCKFHDEGPTYAPKQAALAEKLVDVDFQFTELNKIPQLTDDQKREHAKLTKTRKDLQKQLRDLEVSIRKYQQHLKQFAKCRDSVQGIADTLLPGECLVYRDFVNQYTTDGSKMGNLMLVILYRVVEKEPLRQMKVYNFSGGKGGVRCDPYFVCDVFDFHMKPKAQGGSGVLEHFTKIYISGDHGSHFSATKTVFNESRMFEKYKKKVHVVSLCSYHCYNRCDAAGVLSKNLALTAGREGKELVTSSEYAQSVMELGSSETIGFDFKEINRSVALFGNEKIVSSKKEIGAELRSMCEIDPEVKLQDGTFGYVRGVTKCRSVPFEGSWQVIELREAKLRAFCRSCSASWLGPVYHDGGTECPHTSCEQDHITRGINTNANPTDDSRRMEMILGPQATKGIGRKVFPCFFCKSRYTWGYTANKQ